MKYYKSCKSFMLIMIISLCLLHYMLYYFEIITREGLVYGTPIVVLYLINKYFGKLSLDVDTIGIEYLFTTPLFPNDIKKVKISKLDSIKAKKLLGFEIIYLNYKTGETCILTPKCQSKSFFKHVNEALDNFSE